ncbi:sulfur carrier protein ThiS [Candidatus Laterigemmans baculatus]|uniref:sulfur carrier protein ThiS n=1 Tax=Candidatus Laterigemmans baculatus TaxID=2770505 RepID=UPI0013DBA125|nr:sulfur carrier protein ThiS [Candidatus Laterigemmans baculatus]
MQVTVNGKPHQVDRGTTVIDLLRTAGVPENYLAVEINDDVVPRERHATQTIADGDRIEVVTLVGGG